MGRVPARARAGKFGRNAETRLIFEQGSGGDTWIYAAVWPQEVKVQYVRDRLDPPSGGVSGLWAQGRVSERVDA